MISHTIVYVVLAILSGITLYAAGTPVTRAHRGNEGSGQFELELDDCLDQIERELAETL
ncbi:MAG: hypothetical protein P8Y92_02170 [Halioglobus sp.]|jgi:hypothetical protein